MEEIGKWEEKGGREGERRDQVCASKSVCGDASYGHRMDRMSVGMDRGHGSHTCTVPKGKKRQTSVDLVFLGFLAPAHGIGMGNGKRSQLS